MPVTLLAVDDSATMRKVLEMTFGGEEDIRVVLAKDADSAMIALQKENPDIALVDVTLPGKNGYALCREMKQVRPKMPVVILSAKLHPYDEIQGRSAGADAHIDKPYDTGKMILLVRSVLSPEAKPMSTPKHAPKERLNKTLIGPGAPGTTAAPKRPHAITMPKRPSAPQPSVRTTSDFATGTQAKAPAKSPSKSGHLRSPEPPRSPQPKAPATPVEPAAAQSKPAAQPKPAPQPKPVAQPKPAPQPKPQAPAAATTNLEAQMESQLRGMGLTPEQVQGVLALSKEVIERVVWEVVPPLAETMIKEEIERLTAE